PVGVRRAGRVGSGAEAQARSIHAPRAVTATPLPQARGRRGQDGGVTVCGIAGAYQQPDGKVVVTSMVERLLHRGPDAGAVLELVDPLTSVVLGHRGLSIIDLPPAAAQPMTKGGLTIVYNGELFNYRDLRAE